MESVIRQQTTNHGKNRFTTRIREEVQPEPVQPEGKRNGKKGSSAPAASQNKSLEDESK